MWVVDSGATFHVTGNPIGMVECRPRPPGKTCLVVGDKRSLTVGFVGEFRKAMHCVRGDAQVRLFNVAYVSGVKLNFFRCMFSCRCMK